MTKIVGDVYYVLAHIGREHITPQCIAIQDGVAIDQKVNSVQFAGHLVFSISNTVGVNGEHCFCFRQTRRVVDFTYSCFTTTLPQV